MHITVRHEDAILPPARQRYVSPQPVGFGRLRVEPFLRFGGPPGANMNVDGSATPASFRLTCPTDPGTENYLILRVVWVITGDGFKSDKFCGKQELDNGVVLSAKDVDESILFGGTAIVRTDAGWGPISGATYIWSQDKTIITEWPIHQLGVSPRITPGQYLETLIRDDLSDLESFFGFITYRRERR